ncbi:MAG: hypothetical protein JWM05_3363 [Acidimicrobiales bacterium]|nr:hypothetical protein [Acidimicrobiales bacterium]
MAFAATHNVGAAGASTWDAPDPNLPPSNQLPPGLPVQLLQSSGAWVQVRCSNGWVTFTDGRSLVARSGTRGQAGGARRPTSGTAAKGPAAAMGPAGASITLLGALLPWASGGSANAFDIKFFVLLTNRPTNAPPPAGLVMLLALGAFASLVTRLPGWAFLVCALFAISPPALYLLRWMTTSGPKAGIGVGVVVGLVGGIVLAVAGVSNLMEPPRRR